MTEKKQPVELEDSQDSMMALSPDQALQEEWRFLQHWMLEHVSKIVKQDDLVYYYLSIIKM